MYSPYLYARQSELLALRSVLKEGGDLSKLLPVLEPVVTKASGLIKCIESFNKASLPIIVITNPNKHEFKDDPNRSKLKKFSIDCSLALSGSSTVPAFKIEAGTLAADVDDFLRLYANRRTCLIYESPSLTDKVIERLGKHKDVAYHAVLNDRLPVNHLALLPIKKVIDIRDYFNKQARNANYVGKEFFTDHYTQVGLEYFAYGDYAVVGSSLEIGGGKPAAVAIHLTYEPSGKRELWVEHFVSDDTDRETGSAESKFLEAVDKAVKAVRKRRGEFGRNFALDEYERHHKNRTFPQLGKNKELQIHHHIRRVLTAI